eukprot:199853-Rhodomonas_salina.1
MLTRGGCSRSSRFEPCVKSLQRCVNTTAFMLSCQLVLVSSVICPQACCAMPGAEPFFAPTRRSRRRARRLGAATANS